MMDISMFIQVLDKFGLPVTFLMILGWCVVKLYRANLETTQRQHNESLERENALVVRLREVEDRQDDFSKNILETTTAVLRDNTAAMKELSESLRHRPCLLEKE